MKTKQVLVADMRPEHDFASMKGGVRGKHTWRARESTNIVLIEQEVADTFPTERAVNETLRGVLNTTRAVRQTGKSDQKGAVAGEPREVQRQTTTTVSRGSWPTGERYPR
jgi:hypothetical protein